MAVKLWTRFRGNILHSSYSEDSLRNNIKIGRALFAGHMKQVGMMEQTDCCYLRVREVPESLGQS